MNKCRTGTEKPDQPVHCELEMIPFNISFEGFDLLRFVLLQFYL